MTMRAAAHAEFDGSDDLFCACWRRYLQYLLRGSRKKYKEKENAE